MASVTGSSFVAQAAEPLNLVETKNGNHLPPPILGDFNLEVWTGSGPPGSPASGYDGLAVLDGSGDAVTLVSGSYEIQDTGTGSVIDRMTADGDAQTIAGGPGNNDVFVANGTGDVVIGGGQDTISIFGDNATVEGVGNDLIRLSGSQASISGGTGNDTIQVNAGSDDDTINAGSGADSIKVWGSNDSVDGNGGNDTILVLSGATNDTIEPSGGHNVVTVDSSGNTVIGGGGADNVELNASNDEFQGGTGSYRVEVSADGDTVIGGGGTGAIIATGNDEALSAGTGGPDTIHANGDQNTITGGLVPSAAGGVITSFGNDDVINLGRSGTVLVGGSHDKINAGASFSHDHDTISFKYGSQKLVDKGHVFADTVVGFNQAGGDRIHLAPLDTVATMTVVHGGQDTLITLSDSSTILLKGVTGVDGSFFS